MTKAIPEGYHSITPSFIFKDARKAIEFYKNAFDAKEHYAMPGPDGTGVVHAEMGIGDSVIMMGEENPQQPYRSAETVGESPISFYYYVENVDKAFSRAVEAGAEVTMPVEDMFWGDRMGAVRDPFGYTWMIASHTRDLTPEEIRQGAEAEFARQAEK